LSQSQVSNDRVASGFARVRFALADPDRMQRDAAMAARLWDVSEALVVAHPG
jgi:hypothetical protein